MVDAKLESLMPLMSGTVQAIGTINGGSPEHPCAITEENPHLTSSGNYYVVDVPGHFTHAKTKNGEIFFANSGDGLLFNDLGIIEVIEGTVDTEESEQMGVVVEAIDIQHYLDKVNKQVHETIVVYEQISAQHTKEEGISLMEIANSLLSAMAQTGEELHSSQTIEEGGMINVALPHNTPLIRIQRAITVCSVMSGEPILPQLTLIDNVTAMAVTMLIKSQEAYRAAKAELEAEKVAEATQEVAASEVIH